MSTGKIAGFGAVVVGGALAYQFYCPHAQPKTPPHIIIAGPPAGGKGTQCEKIVEKTGVVHLSTGDLLREEVKKGTPEGKIADEKMRGGNLVPDDIIIAMVKNRMGQDDMKKNGWLLDGFPRTANQAKAMQQAGITAKLFLLLEVPDEVLVERAEGRRTDPVTGKIYHMKFMPPPDDAEIRDRLVHRKDDTREAMEKRLELFHNNQAAIEGFYRDITLKVDGNRNKDVVTKDVFAALDKTFGA